jgi:hypothetical protein
VSLLMRIERYLRRSRMRATKFGLEAVGDPCLILDIKHGRRMGSALRRRVEAFLDEAEAELERKKCRRR